MLSTRIKRLGYLIKLTCISDINRYKVYSYKILIDATSYISESGIRNALLYSGFRKGPLVDIKNIYANFFIRFISYF
jgi:hypothetical protein